MAQNPDFQKLIIKDVTFQWPRLDQPYRYNQTTQRTEACAPGAPNAGYSIAFDMSFDDAKALFETCRAHYDACRARDPKKPPFAQVFGMKKDDATKTARFTAKRRALNNDGKETKPPAVIGADHQPLENPAIWSGSKGDLRVLIFPATDPQTGKGGITFLLDTVKVREATYGGDSYDEDFGEPETGTNSYADFSAPAPRPAARAAQPASPPPAQQPAVAVADDIAF